jgi:hypothetical protein
MRPRFPELTVRHYLFAGLELFSVHRFSVLRWRSLERHLKGLALQQRGCGSAPESGSDNGNAASAFQSTLTLLITPNFLKLPFTILLGIEI